MIDVVIPAHEKDIETLDLCISGVKNSVKMLGDVYVVSRNKLTDEAKWIPESFFPFSIEDVASMIGKHWRTCWYYQQLLKMYTIFVQEDITSSALFVDSDTVFLRSIDFIEEKNLPGNIAHFNIGREHYAPYFEHLDRLLPDIRKQIMEYSGITHHMVFQKDILESLFGDVEKVHGCPFWQAFLQCTLGNFSSVIGDQSHSGQGRASEYEIYFNYCLAKFPNRMNIRKLKSILAYKESLGGNENEEFTIGSRTNDDKHIQTLKESPEFDDIQDALKYAIKNSREQGYDSVTFQKHTRQGIEGYKKDSEDYIVEVCDDPN